MMLLKGNPVTGKMEFHQLDEDYDLKEEIARSTYAGMLHDTPRNLVYQDAVTRAIAARKRNSKSSHVLDIGTGTGILAMMAARCNPDSVTACEVFLPMAKLSEKITKENGYDNIIIVNKTSTEMLIGEDMKHRADILVTEIFDSELIGEGVLPTLRHAHEHLLQPDCSVIPSSGEIFVQLIQSEMIWDTHRINTKKGIYSRLRFPPGMFSCHANPTAMEIQASRLWELDALTLLSKPHIIKKFSFNSAYHHTAGKTSLINIPMKVTNSGTIHAICLWWSISLDTEGEIQLSMAPKWTLENKDDYVWRDHWMQTFYLLKEPVNCKQDKSIEVQCVFDDYSIWFDIPQNTHSQNEIIPIERPRCNCQLHTTWSRERFSLINDTSYQHAIENHFSQLYQDGCRHCVCIGDCSLVPLVAAECGIKQISYIDCGQKGSDVISELVNLNNRNEQITVINRQDKDAQGLVSLLHNSKVDAIFGDAFFGTSLLPWHNLYFWYASSSLSSALPNTPNIYPGQARLKAVAVELKDLWKVRAKVGTSTGFNLNLFDNIIEAALAPDVHPEYGSLHDVSPFPMWEYDHRTVSESTEVMSFDLSTNPPELDVEAVCELEITSLCTCHAVVFWMEMDSANTRDFLCSRVKDLASGFPYHGRQGVYFLPQPGQLVPAHRLKCKAVFQPKLGEMKFNLS